MDIKKSVDELVKKPMDRKQFLASVGAAAVTVVGISSVIKALDSAGGKKSAGYGSGAYGGSKRS